MSDNRQGRRDRRVELTLTEPARQHEHEQNPLALDSLSHRAPT